MLFCFVYYWWDDLREEFMFILPIETMESSDVMFDRFFLNLRFSKLARIFYEFFYDRSLLFLFFAFLSVCCLSSSFLTYRLLEAKGEVWGRVYPLAPPLPLALSGPLLLPVAFPSPYPCLFALMYNCTVTSFH